MNTVIAQLARGLNPLYSAVLATVGGVAGGGVYLTLSGFLLGALTVVGVIGILAILASLITVLTGNSVEASSLAPLALAAAVGPGADKSAAVVIDSTLPAGVPLPAAKIEATETEAQMLAGGRFAEYHLAKAKRYFASKNFKEAAYQASASLAHGDLPEAKSIMAAAKAELKSAQK